MFYYAKAYFRVCCSLVSLTPFLYWPIVKNLPSILATLSAGEADFQSGTQTKSLGDKEKLGFPQGDGCSRVPVRLTLRSGEESVREKDISLEPTTRSWKVPLKGRNKEPDPNYNKGDMAWMTVDGEDGSFKIYVASDGEWFDDEQRWKYQVRQTDGKLYGGGKLVGEEDLNRNKK